MRCADLVESHGGTALVNRVGHAFFKSRMRETGAVFGGEVSGHYYFRDFYCADSGTLPALLILELLSKEGKSLSELLRPLRERYFISGEINSEVEDQDAKMRELEESYASGEVSGLDGVSVDFEDWHFNVRPSNTEPLLRLNLESLVSRRAHGREARRGARAHPRLAASTIASRSPAAMASAEYRSAQSAAMAVRRSSQRARSAANAISAPASAAGEFESTTAQLTPSCPASTSGAWGSSRAKTIGTPKLRLWTIESPTVSGRDAGDRRRVEKRGATRTR